MRLITMSLGIMQSFNGIQRIDIEWPDAWQHEDLYLNDPKLMHTERCPKTKRHKTDAQTRGH